MTIKRQQQLTSCEPPHMANVISPRPINPVTTSSHLSHNRALLYPVAALACLAVAVGALIAAFLNVNEGDYAAAAWSVVLYAISALGACWFLQGEQP